MPLTLGSAAAEVPTSFPALLELLASRPQPAVVWYGEQRIELSGRVLQNWAVKLIGLLTDELDPAPEDVVVVDTAPHWKAAAVVLAAGALGSQVRIPPKGAVAAEAAEGAALIVSDRPTTWVGAEVLGDAELAALSPGMLDDSFVDATGEEVPSWVLDISAEVRQHPDQLLTPLDARPLPPTDTPGEDVGLVVLRSQGQEDPEGQEVETSAWTAWRSLPWDGDAVPALLDAWARGRTVVLWDGSADSPGWDSMLRNEGVR